MEQTVSVSSLMVPGEIKILEAPCGVQKRALASKFTGTSLGLRFLIYPMKVLHAFIS